MNLRMRRGIARLVAWPPAAALLSFAARLVVARHRLGAVVAVLDPDDHVLLLHHVFRPTAPWGLPGGWVGRGETPSDAAARELREETGLVIDPGPVIDLVPERRPNHLTVAFAVRCDQRPSLRLSGEILDAGWYPPDGLPPGPDGLTARIVEAARRATTTPEGAGTIRSSS